MLFWAFLPIRAGGLEIRRVSAMASLAFLSSVYCTPLLQTDLLSRVTFNLKDHYYDVSLVSWSTTYHPVQQLVGNLATKQCSWDQTTVKKTQSSLLASQTTLYHRARLHAASSPHSEDWLLALPISPCGLPLDDKDYILQSVFIWDSICVILECTCCSLVDCMGSHGLSCKRSSGRSA